MELARLDADRMHGRTGAGEEPVRFCTHCATVEARTPAPPEQPLAGRVCTSCGLGVMLHCVEEAMPKAGSALLVVRRDGTISAASAAVEALVDTPADDLIGRPIASLLLAPRHREELERRVDQAAGGRQLVTTLAVVAEGTPLMARIGSCGEPRAALVVLEPR